VNVRIDYTIVFDRSWRIGSGEAAGRFLDSLVRRDGLGLPFVPGSTVRGLARDAVRQLAKSLAIEVCDGSLTRTDGQLGSLCGVGRESLCPLCAITGSPHQQSRVTWGPARLVLSSTGGPVETMRDREALAGQAVLAPRLLTRPRPRTSIDSRSGRAADEKLFTLEESLEGLELAGSLDLDSGLPPRDVSLLVAALRFIHEIGGNRRRGLGACRLRIDRADLAPTFASWQDAVQALAGSAVATQPPPAAPAPEAARRSPAGAQPLTLFQIDATVVGEVVVGRRPEAGNLIAGLPYVAGSTLRGALASLWRGDRESEDFLRAFLSGRVRYGFLYPVAGQTAARPVPLAVHTCKLRPGPVGSFGHGIFDLLLFPTIERCKLCGGRLIPWGPRFAGADAAERLALSPHNRIDPENQTVGANALFAYEALPEGTRLRGFVQAESAPDLEDLLGGLGLSPGDSFRLHVGRRKGTLGHLDCRLSAFSGRPGGVGLFPDADPVAAEWPATGLLRVDLATPALVVDEHLRYRESLTPHDLGLAREGFDEVFAAGLPLTGWNSTHRLPKGDQIAVAAGSSFLLARPASGAAEELAALARAAREGVGLRRVEGFGVVTVRGVSKGELEEGTL
jgi:CRISPR-associated protein Csx10